MKPLRILSAMSLGAALAFAPTLGWSQTSSSSQDDGVKHDAKAAGHDTKDAAKDAGHGVKQGATTAAQATESGTKKAAQRYGAGRHYGSSCNRKRYEEGRKRHCGRHHKGSSRNCKRNQEIVAQNQEHDQWRSTRRERGRREKKTESPVRRLKNSIIDREHAASQGMPAPHNRRRANAGCPGAQVSLLRPGK